MVNYIAIVVASIISFLFGMLWYSPLLFGNVWIKLMGFNKKDMEKAKKKGMGKTLLLSFISTLVTAYVLSYFLVVLRYSSAVDGALFGFMIWLGFLATTMLGGVLWEGKSYSLYFLNITYHLANLIIMGAILGAWV